MPAVSTLLDCDLLRLKRLAAQGAAIAAGSDQLG
jgi:hypothetical protein